MKQAPPTPPTTLLERGRELASLQGLAAEVRAGSGRTVVIEGPPGLGKSSLVAAAGEQARRDGQLEVHSFCCGELEHELAWAGAVGLLGAAVSGLDPSTRADLFAGPAAPAAVLMDDLARTADIHDGDAFGFIHGLYVLVSRLAARAPLLLVLDDAQWCDRPSLEFLAYLQRRLAWHPAGLVVATRPPAQAAERALLERIASAPDTDLHQLASLTSASVAALVRGQAFPDAPPDFCHTCWEVTAGNPFYLHELLIELRERGVDPQTSIARKLSQVAPPSVQRAVLRRLDRLPDHGAAGLARAAAVLGDGATLRHAAGLAQLEQPAAVAALDALAAAELLAPGEPLRFLHPLVRGAIYSDIPAARRAHDHARAARLLAADELSADLVALHLLHAPRTADPQTVTALRTAAERARAQGAPQPAVDYLRRALEEPPSPRERPEVLVELARAETAVGDTRAVKRLSEAVSLVADDRRRAEILLELGWSEHHAGRFPAAAEAFERGLANPAAGEDPELAGELEAGYLVCATLVPARVTDAVERIRVIESGPGDIRTPAHRLLLAQVLFMRTMSGAPRDGIIDLAQRIWGDGRLLRDEGAASHALWHVIGALSWADAYGPALEAIQRTLEAADETGLALAHAQARYARAWPNYWMGYLREAQADARAAIEIWHGGLETYLPAAIYWFGLASLELGEPLRAERALALAGAPERWQATGMMGFIHGLRGHLHFHAGRMEEALACQRACGEVMSSLMITSPGVMPWRTHAARAMRALGESGAARSLAEEELELARSSGGARAIGVALTTVGMCAGGETGVDRLREAVEVLARSGAGLEHARAQAELGAAIRRAGHRREARPHLQAALDLAQRAGALTLARNADTELRAAGGRARRATDTGPDVLTASERRVAELASMGHTNRAIAGQLQVSVKAVEWHLHQCYRKLEIQGRRQLPAALALIGDSAALAG
jgi:tetratricopeptide (TPR) repeat protein